MVKTAQGGIAFVAAMLFCGNACAMSAPDSESPRCLVLNEEKLPAGSGGATALCAAIEQAMARGAPGLEFKAEVRVLSPSMLAADVSAAGRQLPEQKFARSDGELDGNAFKRFAEALAEQAAKTR